MNFRQVHLDFHTSEKIENIGKSFSKENFQEALRVGNVNSITLFSKCHHGWAYHPSKANQMHPNLDFDLLGAEIEAAHEMGVKTPVYLSAGLDEKYAVEHRNYVVRNKNESTTWVPDFLTAGYHKLCMNTPYLDYLLEQIKEVCRNYDADGIFLDIVGVQPCYCQSCMQKLREEGKDPDNIDDVIELAEKVYANYTKKVREAVDSVKPGLPVFHNAGHVRRGRRDLAYANSHLELESLPTGGWGYDHFPISAAYARTLGMEMLGMTGKFHITWGEFGGFKHPNALLYEASLSVANGAKCSIGDQLHPSGKMDIATYALIGEAYKELSEKEEWLEGAEYIADIGVLGTEAIDNYYRGKNFSSAQSSQIGTHDSGAERILLEGKYLFNFIDAEECFEKYKLIILPDRIILDEFLTKKLKSFTANGGKILASGRSGLSENGEQMLDFGCSFVGENEFNPTYLRNEFDIKSLKNSSYIIYAKNYNIENENGKVISYCENPYFNRTVEHFCSHQHAPNNPKDSHPAIVLGNDGIYIGWDVFEEYASQGSITVKETVLALINSLFEKTVETNLPAQGVITLTKQEKRNIVHLLYVSPVKRGNGIEIIEDIIPLYNVEVKVRAEKEPSRVYLAPQRQEIEFKYENGYVCFAVDKIQCHQMIVMED